MTTETYSAPSERWAGFTLAEATLAMVILGVAAAGVLLPFVGGASVQAEGLRRTLGANLAGDLVERIVSTPTPFDQIVGTWHNYAEDQGQIKDASGTTITDPMYAMFSRDVICTYVYVPQQGGGAEPSFIHASVRVYYRGVLIGTVNRLISR